MNVTLEDDGVPTTQNLNDQRTTQNDCSVGGNRGDGKGTILQLNH